MNKKEARKLSLKVWRYLKNNPGVESKVDLPGRLFHEIEHMNSFCPLCEIFPDCDCPLIKCYPVNSWFYKWSHARTKKTRKKYATEIYNKIKAWKV